MWDFLRSLDWELIGKTLAGFAALLVLGLFFLLAGDPSWPGDEDNDRED